MQLRRIAMLLILFAATAGCVDFGLKSSLDGDAGQRLAEIERGRYMIEIMGCNDCHTSWIVGGAAGIPEEDWLLGSDRGIYGSWGTVYPTNLRLLLNTMSEAEWLVIAKQMRRDSPMAWSSLPRVSDSDLRAMYQFVKYLGPKGVPAPAPLAPGGRPGQNYIELPLPH